MSVADVVLSLVMALLLALAARSVWRRRKRGGCCGCCAGCAGCAHAGTPGCVSCGQAAQTSGSAVAVAGKLAGDKRG